MLPAAPAAQPLLQSGMLNLTEEREEMGTVPEMLEEVVAEREDRAVQGLPQVMPERTRRLPEGEVITISAESVERLAQPITTLVPPLKDRPGMTMQPVAVVGAEPAATAPVFAMAETAASRAAVQAGAMQGPMKRELKAKSYSPKPTALSVLQSKKITEVSEAGRSRRRLS